MLEYAAIPTFCALGGGGGGGRGEGAAAGHEQQASFNHACDPVESLMQRDCTAQIFAYVCFLFYFECAFQQSRSRRHLQKRQSTCVQGSLSYDLQL